MNARKKVDVAVRAIALATAIRWAGWGFAEPAFAVFLYSFVKNYTDTGLISASYNFIFLFAVPVVGSMVNRGSARAIIMTGLLLYPFIGLGHTIGGLTGIALFVILAQLVNGVSYAFDSVGRITLIRRHVGAHEIGNALGYFDTVATFGWICAALVGALAVNFIELPWLFAMIIPTSLITLWVVSRIKPDSPPPAAHQEQHGFLMPYRQFMRAVRHWRSPMRQCAISTVLTGMLSVVNGLIIPIYSYVGGASLTKVMLLGAFASVPMLFGSRLGWLVDRSPKKARTIAFICAGVLIALLALTGNYYLQLAIAFLIGITVELASLANAAIIMHLAKPENYGTVTSELQFLGSLGAMLAPIAIGGLIDWLGSAGGLAVVSVMFLSLALYLNRARVHGFELDMLFALRRARHATTTASLNN